MDQGLPLGFWWKPETWTSDIHRVPSISIRLGSQHGLLRGSTDYGRRHGTVPQDGPPTPPLPSAIVQAIDMDTLSGGRLVIQATGINISLGHSRSINTNMASGGSLGHRHQHASAGGKSQTPIWQPAAAQSHHVDPRHQHWTGASARTTDTSRFLVVARTTETNMDSVDSGDSTDNEDLWRRPDPENDRHPVIAQSQ